MILLKNDLANDIVEKELNPVETVQWIKRLASLSLGNVQLEPSLSLSSRETVLLTEFSLSGGHFILWSK